MRSPFILHPGVFGKKMDSSLRIDPFFRLFLEFLGLLLQLGGREIDGRWFPGVLVIHRGHGAIATGTTGKLIKLASPLVCQTRCVAF
jgi:hypothetical protein